MRRDAPFFVLLSLASLAVFSCKGQSPDPVGDVRWSDAGAAEVYLDGKPATPIPPGELTKNEKPAIFSDGTGKRFAYATSIGDERLLYVIGGSTYLGPKTIMPLDFHTAPDLEHALGDIFDAAGPRRDALAKDVRAALGDAGVVKMLASAQTTGRDYDELYASLSDGEKKDLQAALAATLEKGKPTIGLRHAVTIVPLADPALAPKLDARVRELVEPVRDPASSAVLVRALAKLDAARAAAAACVVLEKVDPKAKTGDASEGPARQALVEAALVALAADAEARHSLACAKVEGFVADACLPYFRCANGAPLTGRETTKQDEPLCTSAELAGVVEKELARAPADVIAQPSGTRPALFAYAALAAANALPAPFVAAHARRLYALTQPATPICEGGVPAGKPCHCDEATVRDQACRHGGGTNIHVGVCKFDIDDAKKTMGGTTASLPP